MTVIFANNNDIDCMTLPKIWEGQPNVNLIEITKDSINWEEKVDEAIMRTMYTSSRQRMLSVYGVMLQTSVRHITLMPLPHQCLFQTA